MAGFCSFQHLHLCQGAAHSAIQTQLVAHHHISMAKCPSAPANIFYDISRTLATPWAEEEGVVSKGGGGRGGRGEGPKAVSA